MAPRDNSGRYGASRRVIAGGIIGFPVDERSNDNRCYDQPEANTIEELDKVGNIFHGYWFLK